MSRPTSDLNLTGLTAKSKLQTTQSSPRTAATTGLPPPQPWQPESQCMYPKLEIGQVGQIGPWGTRNGSRYGVRIADDLTLSSSFNQQVLYDTTPLPDSIPKVKEIGTTSAPLFSAAYFIGARCKDYNDDFMKCKTENPGKGEFECLKEGRRVTRCARSVYVFSPASV